MKIYKKIMDLLAVIEKFILIVTGLGTTIITFLAVVGRKTAWYKFTWSEEIVINVFIIMIMCGCALAAREGGLISLSLIYDMVPLKAKKVIATISNAVSVAFYAMDQLTNGSQTEGIQAVCDGSIDLSAHSNLIYSNFDQRLNVVSLPFIFDSTAEVDEVLDGAGYDALAPIVEGMGLHLMGIAENGFRHITNNQRPIESLTDMNGLVIRVAGAQVLKDEYEAWGTNYTTANWSEVYTGLQTGTYEAQENPLPTADASSISDVQDYVTYWTGVYDCIFFTMNQELYESFSPEMQALIDEAGAYAANNQRQLERQGDEEVLAKWADGGMTVSYLSDEAVQDFKDAAAGVPAKFVQTCVSLGFDQTEVEEMVAIFVGE